MSFRGFCWIRCLSRKVFASILLCTILFSSSGVLAQFASTSTVGVFEEAQRAFDQGVFAAAVPACEQGRRDAPPRKDAPPALFSSYFRFLAKPLALSLSLTPP